MHKLIISIEWGEVIDFIYRRSDRQKLWVTTPPIVFCYRPRIGGLPPRQKFFRIFHFDSKLA